MRWQGSVGLAAPLITSSARLFRNISINKSHLTDSDRHWLPTLHVLFMSDKKTVRVQSSVQSQLHFSSQNINRTKVSGCHHRWWKTILFFFFFFKHTWTGLFVCFFTSVTPKSHRWRFGDVYRVAWMFRAVVNKDGRCCQMAHIISLTTNSMFGFMCREEIATHSFSKLSSPSPTSLRGIALLWLVILISALQAFKRS